MSAGSPEVRRVDADGVVRVERAGGRRWWIPLGAALFGGVAIALAWVAGAPQPGPSEEPSGASETRAPPQAPARAWPVAFRPAAATPTGSEEEEGSQDMASETPPGGPSGMALFPPPGTKPIKRGIIVPEQFELPPGYVRHYQSTDDGQQLPAILMFHPDFHPVDAKGQPVPIPSDRVVPAELAPPGLPIQPHPPPERRGGGGTGP